MRFPDSYRDWLRTQLMEAVEVSAPYLQGAKIWAFIGPTGVGKTTTLAKLAAHFHLRMSQTNHPHYDRYVPDWGH